MSTTTQRSSEPAGAPRVCAILYGRSNCERVRVVLPFRELRRAGMVADHVPVEKVAAAGSLGAYDLFVLPRLIPDEGYLEVLAELRRYRKKYVYEIDDAFLDAHADNPLAAPIVQDQGKVRRLKEILAWADAVTVSTPYLAGKMRQFNPRVYTLPNCMREEDWALAQRPMRVAKGITVGWVGSHSHASDLKLIVEPLKRLADRHRDVTFVFGGFCLEEIRRALGDRLVYLDPVPIDRYPGMVSQIDVGLAPLIDSEFNRSKSSIKYQEFAMLGIPCVASPVEPYLCVNHGFTGFLARTPDDWFRHAGRLIGDARLRRQVGQAARQWVLTNRNIRREAHRWAETYADIWRR